jgi:hypothetical protein
MSVGGQHLQYLQKPTFLTYYGLGIYNEWTAAPPRHHLHSEGGQDIIPGIIYTVSSVMHDMLFPLFSLG